MAAPLPRMVIYGLTRWLAQYESASANPDTEIITAVRPGLATIPTSLLLCIGSPYARRGALWQAYDRHFGKGSPMLVWQGTTRDMNPSIDPAIIAQAYEEDEAGDRRSMGAIQARHRSVCLARGC